MTELSTVPDVTGATGGTSLHSVPDLSPVDAPLTKRERETQWMAAALETPDLSALPLAELRVLANRMFRVLDSDHPPLQAAERYAAAVEEIAERSRRIAGRGEAGGVREGFKDSRFNSRFELYLDGSLAVYIRYSMCGAQLTMRAMVEKPGFEGQGLDRVLMRHALLSAHRRRLGVVAGCPGAQAFLEQNPQYRVLARIPR